jgi:penicillin-binding protein 1A
MRILHVAILLLFLLGVCSPAGGQPGFRRGADRAVPARIRGNQAEQLYLTGRRYIEQGYYGEGLDALNQSLALRPGHARALTYKGIALLALREPRLALQQLDAALAIDPDDGVSYGTRGLVYIAVGDESRARDDLRKAAKLRPDLVPWFNQQSQWIAANRQFLYREGMPSTEEQAAPAATPGGGAAAEPPPVPSATGDQPGAYSRLRQQFDIADAISLLKPAAFVVLGFLALLVALRLMFAGARYMMRRRGQPWRSRLHGVSPAGGVQAGRPFPIDGEDSEGLGLPRQPRRKALAFLRRHRALGYVAGAGLAAIAIFAAPVLVQAFRLDANKLTSPRVRPSVLDFRGNVYTHLGAPDMPVKFEDLPEHLVDALRAREDSRFFEHHGVDWLGLARALVTDISHMRIKQGASTLTMQLVEKVYGREEKGLLSRLRSKLVEWTMAHRAEAALERQLGDRRAAKEAIMTAYLNRVEFGGGTVGVGAASMYYFNKPVSNLTLGESCMLVALLRAPTANSPYRNPENAKLARDKIVAQMVRRGYITEDQGKQARFFVVDNPLKPEPEHNGYLVAAITREINALKADKKVPADVWEHEDLVIQSTLDLWAQDILDSEIRKVVTAFKGDTARDPLGGAGLIVDNATGQVRALVSGQDYSKSQYDLALSSRRQVASIAKPFVYGAYVEQGGDMAETLPNTPLTTDEIKALNDWNPRNDSSLKPGEYPLAKGLAFSDNLITVRVGLKAGLRRVYDTLYAAGLVSDKTTTGTTWLLGTFESSLANVVSAYTAFPRGGARAVPYLVQSIKLGGKEIYHAQPQTRQLFSERTCAQIHQALLETMTEGTGRSAMRSAGIKGSIAGKTGTSQNSADVWWVGYIDDVTLGVRFGRDSNASLGDAAAGGTIAAPAAARVFKQLAQRYSID